MIDAPTIDLDNKQAVRMELRSTEEELQSLRAIYEALCRSAPQLPAQERSGTTVNWPTLPPPPPQLVLAPGSSTTEEDTATANGTSSSLSDSAATATRASTGKCEQINGYEENEATVDSNSSAVEILEQLEGLQCRLCALEIPMQKFQKRLSDQDPVTQKPRYGEKTAERVQILLENYRDLCLVLGTIFGEPSVVILDGSVVTENEKSIAITTTTANHGQSSATTTIANSIRQLADKEVQEQQRQSAAAEQRRRAQAEAQRQADEQQRLQEEQAAAERARQIQAAADERARHAAASRAAVERARQAEAAAERAWLDRIPNKKTLDGVREQLAVFAASSPKESMTALHTIFSQIAAHPEEDKFRRIRRDHQGFINDIGQYPGGREVLIAAGFELGFVEEVPSFVCKEPNIEQDMDGWATWFDLLKGTLELIEQEMMK